ncbi:hypothetical protein [Sphingomonas mesophila]|uniref:hypothetical protein n=1 Tax=Sphingomonas mesophila TaxID=2303576 RepID=UPI000E5706EA|nr:hypothetical protein [Sphingomonas mesophila]
MAILNAPFDERGWEGAVQSIADATRSHSAQLLGIGGPLLLPLNVFVGPPAAYRHHIDCPDLYGPCNWRIGSATVAMAIQHEADYAAYRHHHDTALYDDVASDMDIPFGCQSALLFDRHSMIGIAVHRGRRDGPCHADTLAVFADLRLHMARAVRMQIALDGEAAELMVGDMEALHGATILLDRLGCIAALTPAAEPLLADDGPLRLTGLALELVDPSDNARFHRLVGQMLRSEVADAARLAIGRTAAQPKGRWNLYLTRLPRRRDHGLGFDPHLAVTVKPMA